MKDIKERIKDSLLHDAPLDEGTENGRTLHAAVAAREGDAAAARLCALLPQYPNLVVAVEFWSLRYFVADSFSSDEFMLLDDLSDEQLTVLAQFMGLE